MIINNLSNVVYSYVLPDGNTITDTKDSNVVSTEVLTYNFLKVKSSNKTFLREGEIAEQSVTLTNSSSQNLTNLFFKDIMTDGASHVSGSVIINGISYPLYDLITGFSLPNMNPGDVTEVKYNVIANNPLTQNLVVNRANISYIANETNFAENTNDVNLIVVSSRLSVIKQVDKSVAVKGDILHYTNTVLNTGTLDKTNLTFRDLIPVGTSFVVGSVKINSVPQPTYNPETGFPLPDLAVGENAIVEFDVEVI